MLKKIMDALKKLRPRTKSQAVQLALILVLTVVAVFNVPPAAVMVFNTYASGAKKKLPIYSVGRDDNKISISFDAAWGADDTDNILKILEDNNVKATFFLCGYWVDKYPEEVKRIFDAGHDIGNHGNTHAHGAQLTLEQNKAEILRCNEKIKAITGQDANLFRPPYGEYNDTVIQAAADVNYYPIQWDVEAIATVLHS